MGKIRDHAQQNLDYAKQEFERTRDLLTRAERAFDQAIIDDAKPDCSTIRETTPARQCLAKAGGYVTVNYNRTEETPNSYQEFPVCRVHAWRELERQQKEHPGAHCSIILMR